MLSRRSVFVRLAATAAVLKLPWVAPAEAEPAALWIGHGHEVARLIELKYELLPPIVADDWVRVRVSRVGYKTGDRAAPLLHWTFHPYARVHWVAAPGWDEIVIRPKSPVQFDIDPRHNTIFTMVFDVRAQGETMPCLLTKTVETRAGKIVSIETGPL